MATLRALPLSTGTSVGGGLPLVDRDVPRLGGAGVDLTGTPDLGLRALHHLLPVRDPAGQASDREQDGEHLLGAAHRAVNEARVEGDVRVALAIDEEGVGER